MFMAVQADHLHLLPHQFIQSRETITDMQSFQTNIHSAAPISGPSMPISGDAAAVIPFNHGIFAATGASVAAIGGGGAFDNLATFSGSLPRKRPMNSDGEFSFQDAYELEINQMINLHVEKVRIEVAARRRRFARQLTVTVERAAAKRLKAREDEIHRMRTLNFALEERVKALLVESHSWRELAAAKEAEADALRSNIQQAIIEAGRIEENGAAEEAESCCDNQGDSDEVEGAGAGDLRRRCKQCCRGEPSVLLLPCRHLCVCVDCGSSVSFCPVCYSSKKGSINVSMA